MTNTDYLDSFQLTVVRVLVAFAIAVVLGIICALLAARSMIIDNLIYYLTEFFRQLPAVAVIPFAIVIFGIYTSMKIAVAVFGCFFPVFVATREGLKNVEPGLMITAKTYRWSGSRLLLGVMLPSAVPHILGVLRITLAISLILVVMSEMLIGGDGLGMRIVEKERTFDFPGLYAETFLLGTTGVILNLLLGVISRRIYYWRSDTDWRKSK
jgi:ABC-type nitrate/sulfonate/bicarbonate transport system permease component